MSLMSDFDWTVFQTEQDDEDDGTEEIPDFPATDPEVTTDDNS